jgi:Flp pilus assembly protein TadG
MARRGLGEAGGAYLEFTISALLFFFSMFLLCDLLRLSFKAISAQDVVEDAVREVTLHATSASDARDKVRNTAVRRGLDLGSTLAEQNGNIKICSLESIDACSYGTLPSITWLQRDTISASIKFDFHFMIWGGAYEVRADAIGKIEPATS